MAAGLLVVMVVWCGGVVVMVSVVVEMMGMGIGYIE